MKLTGTIRQSTHKIFVLYEYNLCIELNKKQIKRHIQKRLHHICTYLEATLYIKTEKKECFYFSTKIGKKNTQSFILYYIRYRHLDKCGWHNNFLHLNCFCYSFSPKLSCKCRIKNGQRVLRSG